MHEKNILFKKFKLLNIKFKQELLIFFVTFFFYFLFTELATLIHYKKIINLKWNNYVYLKI